MVAPLGARPVASLDESTRSTFIIRVYQHLFAAIVAFVAFEVLLFNLGIAEAIWDLVSGSSGAWLLVLGGVMGVSWLGTRAAHHLLNPSRQKPGPFGLGGGQGL